MGVGEFSLPEPAGAGLVGRRAMGADEAARRSASQGPNLFDRTHRLT
jgi:hypothetical protein